MSQRYDFLDKRDLLGCFGYVAPDKENPEQDHIVSLGFIVNECPSRSILDFESQYMKEYIKKQKEISMENEPKDHGKGIATVAVIIIGSAGSLSILYCCLKSRGKLCKKIDKTKEGGKEP